MYYPKRKKTSQNNSCKNHQTTQQTNHKREKYYVYSLNLEGGNKYVGMTGNLDRRIKQHASGNGAKWTQKHEPVSINRVSEYNTKQEARKAETEVYYKMKKWHGDKVRGAGNVKPY